MENRRIKDRYKVISLPISHLNFTHAHTYIYVPLIII